MTSPIVYGEHAPSPELNQWIAAYWFFEADDSVKEVEHRIPPNGGVTLTVLPDAQVVFTGPYVEPRPVMIRGGMHVWGAIFWPGSAAAFLQVEMQQLAPLWIPGTDILSPEALQRISELTKPARGSMDIQEILNRFLMELSATALPMDPVVMQLVFRIIQSRGEETVQNLSEGLELSDRQLRRRFRKQVGLSPKELLRVQRMRSCATQSVNDPGVSWVDLAARLGYSDQAHLIREFQKLMGMTPVQFEKQLRSIQHKELIR